MEYGERPNISKMLEGVIGVTEGEKAVEGMLAGFKWVFQSTTTLGDRPVFLNLVSFRSDPAML